MEFRFNCPKCNQKMKADLVNAGRKAVCRACNSEFLSPQPPGSAGPSVAGGKFTCPVCWERFDLGDVMHIAGHNSLRGDPVLGPDEQQRFKAVRFNNAGQALDAMGAVGFDCACPFCRRKLPPGFFEMPHYIISLVGDQSAGKSYFLSVLIKVFPPVIFNQFSVQFTDSDPTANALLIDPGNPIFGGDGGGHIRIAKRVFDDANYVKVLWRGRLVAFPRPFIFTATPKHQPAERCGLVFYKNAREHFQPPVTSCNAPDWVFYEKPGEQPGAQHVAFAAGIMFLFDPSNSREFRAAIEENPYRAKGQHGSTAQSDFGTADTGAGPKQFERPVLDQQDIILAEMRNRIQNIQNLPPDETPHTPVAFIVCKSDIWTQLLEGTPLRDEPFNESATKYNSIIIRNLLLKHGGNVVANAERVSTNIMYFAVSSFGHTPVKDAAGDWSAIRNRIKPVRVEMPLMWILSQIKPSILAGVGPQGSDASASDSRK